MTGISITVVIGLLAVLLTNYFARRSWQINLIEEIRVRETNACMDLLGRMSAAIDHRIAAQRLFLSLIKHNGPTDEQLDSYRAAVRDWLGEMTTIRSKIMFYYSYEDVRLYEESILNKISESGRIVERAVRSYRDFGTLRPEDSVAIDQSSGRLDKISAEAFRLVYRLHAKIAKEEFGTLRRVRDVGDHSNPYISNFDIIKRILNT